MADPGRKSGHVIEEDLKQGLPLVSAVQDSVEQRAKRSQLNLKSIFPSTGAFSGTNGER